MPTVGTAVAQVRERGCFAGERFEKIETVFAVFLDSLPTIAHTSGIVGGTCAMPSRRV